MFNIEEYKKIFEESKKTMDSLNKAQNEIFSLLGKEKPELFEKISRDMQTLRTTKDLSVINKIIQEYADSNNQQ